MNDTDEVVRQAALVASLVKRQPGIGRTALMKYVYLLQTVKGTPLGFDFAIYTYGPYDSAVLSRVAMGVRWGAIKEQTVHHPSGTGYELKAGPSVDDVLGLDSDFLAGQEANIRWVVETFGGFTAAKMELIATMVFADREAKACGSAMAKEDLIDRVLAIKPKFTRDTVDLIYEDMKGELQLGVS